MRHLLPFWLTFVALVLGFVLPAVAQDRIGSMSGAAPEQEALKYLWYMAAAYAIIWAAALLYFVSLSRKEQAILTEIRNLKAEIASQFEARKPGR